MPPSVIVAAASMRDYFQDAIATALKNQAMAPEEATALYLVDLLCDFAKAGDSDPEQPLALIMAKSQFALPAQSMPQLKHVGDQSLYVSGFFSDSLRRSHLDPAYYVVLGGAAYRRLSGILRRSRTETRLVIVYAELGHEFSRFVQVLSDVKNQALQPGLEISDLYEEWLRTGSECTAQQLHAAGLLVLKKPGGIKQ